MVTPLVLVINYKSKAYEVGRITDLAIITTANTIIPKTENHEYDLVSYGKSTHLPKDELDSFSKWLYGQTLPYIENTQKGEFYFYMHDYDRWKAGLPVID